MSSNGIVEKLLSFVIPDFYNSLHILLTNCDSLPRFLDEKGEQRIGVIEGISKLSKQDREAVNLSVKKWLEKRLPIPNEAVDEKALIDWAKSMLENLKDPHRYATSLLSKDIVEGSTADLINQCISKYQVQSSLFDDDEIFRQLSGRNLLLLEPWAQAGVCGYCNGFELLLSSFPQRDEKCPTCKGNMSLIRIYKLNKEYEKLKLENKDLPEFIKSYIQNKAQIKEIFTSYQTRNSLDGKTDGDIDVYIPSTKTGIECKLFVHPNAEGKYLKSCMANLATSFKKYIESGKVERLIGVINLDQSYQNDVENEVRNLLKKDNVQFTDLKIICYSFEQLHKMLEDEILLLKKSA